MATDSTEVVPELAPAEEKVSEDAEVDVQASSKFSLAEALVEIKRLYDTVDPVKTPYRSSYKARDVIKIGIRAREKLLGGPQTAGLKLETITEATKEPDAETLEFDPTDAPTSFKQADQDVDRETVTYEVQILKYELAYNLIDTEERAQGEPMLQAVLDHFQKTPMKIAARYIRGINTLAIIWSERGDSPKSRTYLEEAEKVYQQAKGLWDSDPSSAPFDEKEVEKIETQHTLTCFYLAQVYGHLDETDKSAWYCHQTLMRQMDVKDFDPKEWVASVVGLTDYYAGIKRFRQAQYCLQAAEVVNPIKKRLEELDDEDDQKVLADMTWAWARLYARMLQCSMQTMLEVDDESKRKEFASTDATLNTFTGIEVEEPGEILLATNFEEARALFVPSLKQYTQTLKFYIMDGFVTDHIQILQSISMLYKSLIFFEPDLSRKCKMHKRRINQLKDVEKELNPNVFMSTLRQLQSELGCVYDDMGDLKMQILRDDMAKKATEAVEGAPQEMDAKKVTKINNLYTNAIFYLTKFIRTFEDPQPGTKPGEERGVDPFYVNDYLSTKFFLASIFGKFQNQPKDVHIGNIQKALRLYNEIVKFCNEEDDVEDFDQQLEICKTMQELLPLKMDAIRQNIDIKALAELAV